MHDFEEEFTRSLDKVYATLSSVPTKGFVATSGGVFFDEALVEKALVAAEKALQAHPNLDLVRLARATLLQTLGRLSEAEEDANVLVAKGGEIAVPAKVLRQQVRKAAQKGRGS